MTREESGELHRSILPTRSEYRWNVILESSQYVYIFFLPISRKRSEKRIFGALHIEPIRRDARFSITTSISRRAFEESPCICKKKQGITKLFSDLSRFGRSVGVTFFRNSDLHGA